MNENVIRPLSFRMQVTAVSARLNVLSVDGTSKGPGSAESLSDRTMVLVTNAKKAAADARKEGPVSDEVRFWEKGRDVCLVMNAGAALYRAASSQPSELPEDVLKQMKPIVRHQRLGQSQPEVAYSLACLFAEAERLFPSAEILSVGAETLGLDDQATIALFMLKLAATRLPRRQMAWNDPSLRHLRGKYGPKFAEAVGGAPDTASDDEPTTRWAADGSALPPARRDEIVALIRSLPRRSE